MAQGEEKKVNIGVGQIIYLLSNKDIKVYPAQVVEEINRKTLSGSETSYVIKLPDRNQSEVHISKIDAEIFTSAEELEEAMINNAKTKIRSLLNSAKELESMFDNVPQQIDNSDILISGDRKESDVVDTQPKKKRRRRRATPKEKKDEKITVDLGGGLTAKMDPAVIDNIGVSNE